MTEITGVRTRHVVTHNPNKANPGEVLYITIPKLKPDVCLVPDSFHILFDFKNANAKSRFNNNLSRLLTERLMVTMSGEVVYENIGESTIEIYKDLWKTDKERGDMIEYGVAGLNLRKLISKDDSGASSGDEEKVSDALMFKVHGTKQRIKLGKILEDHGLSAPYEMINNLVYTIKLPAADDIMKAQSGSSVGGYSLENIELEYETIENKTITDEVVSGYEVGRSLSFEHVTLMKTTEWDKDNTLVNETINLPRKSMRAIIMLFKSKSPSGSEEYVYPDIDSVKVTIEGVPSSVYSQGIPKSRFYEEASRVFGCSEEVATMRKFYKDQFALVIDLRTINDNVTGTGKKIINTQSGILLEIKKTAITANVMCKLFVISDGLLNISNRDLDNIQY